MTLTYSMHGLDRAISLLAEADSRVGKALEVGVTRGVQGGVSIVRGHASGRPGPNVITGAFRRSIQADTEGSGSSFSGQIGSNAPQGARLEAGFYGPDSLGRVYAQPPFPSFTPAVPAVTELVVSETVSAVQAAFS